jgi:hypothetical protein
MNDQSKPLSLRSKSFIYLGINWAIFFLLVHILGNGRLNTQVVFGAGIALGATLIALLLLVGPIILVVLLILSLMTIAVWASNSKGKVSTTTIEWSTFVSITLNVILIVAAIYTCMNITSGP